jgi:galactokinase
LQARRRLIPPDLIHDRSGQVARAFRARFAKPSRVFQAPGRINIIGEHTDYSGGLVMPAAIDRRCLIAIAFNGTRTINVASANLKAEAQLECDRLAPTGQWFDYIAGVAATLSKAGVPIEGCDIWIDSDVPIGAGVSSSAALEVALAQAFTALAGHAADGTMIARWAQSAENDFVGMPCGIMDQYASANGVADCALLLDCRSLQSEPLPLPIDHSFLLINSMIRHAHTTGEYRRRREECEFAARALHVKELRDVPETALPDALGNLPDGPARRCRHVVSEISRVEASADYLRAGDITALGKAMNTSHVSLRDDMQVSVPQVDALVAMAQATPGVVGARMMGGGFGGCVIALVQSERADHILKDLVARYSKHIGETPDAFICHAVVGAGEIML